MNNEFAAAMRRATGLTRALNLSDATHVIRDALAGKSGGTAAEILSPSAKPRSAHFKADPEAEVIAPLAEPEPASAPAEPSRQAPRLRMSLADTLRTLREGRAKPNLFGSLPGMAKRSPSPAIPPDAQFLAQSFTCAAGTRSYKLYVPASAQRRPQGLIVMLHGCTQNPDDFAVGTGMNAVAEAHGLLVAYPSQTGADNASSCWNWFRPSDQRRGAGEPAIIAGITQEIVDAFDFDRGRIFVAGLSAGGAMAAVMGETYPDLYSAVGIHSGLAYGAANDVVSAFAVMRGDVVPSYRSTTSAPVRSSPPMRTIVFQGSADRTVHPVNAERIVAAALSSEVNVVRKQNGQIDGGRAFERTIAATRDGTPAMEYWLVHEAGHAWSGGHAQASYTDPQGPDASSEMVRFFLSIRN